MMRMRVDLLLYIPKGNVSMLSMLMQRVDGLPGIAVVEDGRRKQRRGPHKMRQVDRRGYPRRDRRAKVLIKFEGALLERQEVT